MSRPVEIDEQHLLEVARELFLKKGASATTAEVAKKLGIAQGSLFRRYKTKQALFQAALFSQKLPWVGSLARRADEAGLEEALVQTGLEIVQFYRKVVPLLLVGWSNRGEFGMQKNLRSWSSPPPQALEMIAFFGKQVKAGRLRRVDPQLVAASYVGPLMAYALVELIRTKHPIPLRKYVRGFVQLLWSGISPDGGDS
jgi:AcrR family transcriptional regulator